MKRKNLILIASLAVLICFSVSSAPAQQQPPAPVSSGASQSGAPASGGSQNGAVPAANGVSAPDSRNIDFVSQAEPDTRPLTGAELYSLGSLGKPRDVFDPSFFAIESGTLTATTPGSEQLSSITTVGASLSVSHPWTHSQLVVSYNGVGNFYRGQSSASENTQTQYQSLGLSEVVSVGRWAFRIRDDFSYAPQSPFGGQSIGGPGLIGQVGSNGVLGGLNPNFSQDQTIQTVEAARINNTALGEIDYSASRRTQFTFTGSYGLVDFIQSGFFNSHDTRGQAGYSYLLDPRNTIGLTASYDRTTYNTGVAIANSQYALSLGRKVTGRLALQASGGASLIQFEDFVPALGQQWIWTASAALAYSMRRNSYSLGYSHGATQGSGVVLGAAVHTLTASMSHHFSRFTSAGLNGGYSVTNALAPSLGMANSYHGWYGGANLSRQVGRHVTAGFNYGAQRQTTGAGSCPPAGCAPSSVVQTFGLNLTWHPLPIIIE